MPVGSSRYWLAPLVAGAMAFLTQAALIWRLGVDLHALLGSVLIAAVVAPPFSAIARSAMEFAFVVLAVVSGITVVWLLPTVRAVTDGSIVLQCVLLLIAWTFCVASISRGLARLFGEPTLGSAATTAAALLWLAAPIWLGTHAVPIVRFHPLLAMNGPLMGLGLWTEQPFEYRYLFSLGQDVPYLLPSSIAPCCVLQGLIGVFFAVPGFWQVIVVGEPTTPVKTP